MLSSLPSLAPRDSHTLWYTSTHHPSSAVGSSLDSSNQHANHGVNAGPDSSPNNGIAGANRRVPPGLLQRSPLARLRADEQYMERRKSNVKNYGSSWLKPPGVMKTLFQIQEERREMEEHEEALRRERLVQELADAEAEAAGAEAMEDDPGDPGDLQAQDDMLGMEGRDLDDDIPDADADLDAEVSDDSDEDEDEDEVEDSSPVQVRRPEQAYREALARHMDGGGLDDDDEDMAPQVRAVMESQMITEEDLRQRQQVSLDMHDGYEEDGHPWGSEADVEIPMDGNLDDEVPEAEDGEYEHTDTDASLESSDEDDGSVDGFGNHDHRSERNGAHGFGSSVVRSDGTQRSLDLGVLDATQSSFLQSSPQMRGSRRLQ